MHALCTGPTLVPEIRGVSLGWRGCWACASGECALPGTPSRASSGCESIKLSTRWPHARAPHAAVGLGVQRSARGGGRAWWRWRRRNGAEHAGCMRSYVTAVVRPAHAADWRSSQSLRQNPTASRGCRSTQSGAALHAVLVSLRVCHASLPCGGLAPPCAASRCTRHSCQSCDQSTCVRACVPRIG